MPLFLVCGFYIIPICTCIDSVRKILGNQIVSTLSIIVIQFSKYLSFHLGVVLVHANWVNLMYVYSTSFPQLFHGFPQNEYAFY